MKQPIQPVISSEQGRICFQRNAIVCKLLEVAEKHGYGLNEIAAAGDSFSDDDRQQLTQLIGYSLSGYGGLPYVSSEAMSAAELRFGMGDTEARIASLQGALKEIRDSFRAPVAALYGIHPGDLEVD